MDLQRLGLKFENETFGSETLSRFFPRFKKIESFETSFHIVYLTQSGSG
jgi:hypothetical protein